MRLPVRAGCGTSTASGQRPTAGNPDELRTGEGLAQAGPALIGPAERGDWYRVRGRRAGRTSAWGVFAPRADPPEPGGPSPGKGGVPPERAGSGRAGVRMPRLAGGDRRPGRLRIRESAAGPATGGRPS